MYQIDNSTAAASQPASTGAGTPGFFTDGNPAGGVAATIVPAEWLNAVMMEICNAITASGLTLSKSTFTQLATAIRAAGRTPAILNDTGAANAYAAANVPALVSGTWVDGVVQRVKISNTNTGPSTYSPDGLTAIPIYGLALSALQGGELKAGGVAAMMRFTVAGVNSGNPICVLIDCFGGAQQVPAATQSNHAVQLGQLPALGLIKSVKTTVATSSGTYTPSAGMAFVLVEGCAGGGAGGGAPGVSGQGAAGGGGGGGAFIRRLYSAAEIGASQPFTVGSGGAGVSGATGGTGGNSTFGAGATLLSCGGGGGGVSSVSSSAVGATGNGGVGGTGSSTPSGADVQQGWPGSYGIGGGVNGGTGGIGGSGYFGTGGATVANASGNVATGFGAGGGGAGAQATTTLGGKGTGGKWKFTEYLAQ